MATYSNTELSHPYRGGVAVTKHDDTVYDPPFRGLLIGGAGNVAVRFVSGEIVTLTGLLAGTVYNVLVDQVRSTNTTATNIVGLK